jgi:outer membrane protein assembly factor BamB
VLNGVTQVALGRGDGKVVAYDLATGDQPWTYDAEEAVPGTPASFGRSS